MTSQTFQSHEREMNIISALDIPIYLISNAADESIFLETRVQHIEIFNIYD